MTLESLAYDLVTLAPMCSPSLGIYRQCQPGIPSELSQPWEEERG